ncbi:MAG: hypothetical protein TEF_05775 [Rhizobiales bacterium NRL2]|jgi:hypothetical protein|nr:MAG: hypothetical protein TEF_05775 [Rhizobiales bacterium NRL2]
MSRLDSFIQRLQAQRACLDAAAAMIADLPGPALELGLGNGRTYDHLRALLPGRRIFVFEREVRAQPDCVPPAADLFLGDFTEQLPGAMARIGEPAALVHADIGTGDKAASLALARSIAGAVVDLMRPGAVLLSDQPFGDSRLRSVPLPDGVAAGRYHLSIATE